MLNLAKKHTRETKGSNEGLLPIEPIIGRFSLRCLAMGLLLPNMKSIRSTTMSNSVSKK